MKGEKPKTQESCPRKNSAERERYEGAPTLIGMVGDELVEVQLSSDRMLNTSSLPTTLTEHTDKSRPTRGAEESTEWRWNNCFRICVNTRMS